MANDIKKLNSIYSQPWAMTGGIIPIPMDYDRGFYLSLDNGNLDAPICTPGGSTLKGIDHFNNNRIFPCGTICLIEGRI